jgi:mRNA interferase MazF
LIINRGEIYFVELMPTKGREPAGYRPVLVVSADIINRQPLVITVVVGTKASNITYNYPINVRVTADETGLPEDTVFLCFQIRSLDPARFIDSRTGKLKLAGTMPPQKMTDIALALKAVLDLP